LVPPPNLEVEAILLGSDINYLPEHLGKMVRDIRATQHPDTYIIAVPGNGDYIDQDIEESRRRYHEAVDSVPNAIFLDDDVIVLPSGLRVIGSTLWDLIDEGKIDQHDQKWRDMGLKGVDNIRIGDHYLSARDVNAFYRKSRSFIEDQLRSLSPAERERTIVCTHFWPTFLPWRDASGAVPDEWYHATASDMDEFLAQWGPNRWLCGHSHETKAVTIGPTRVSSNPRMGAGPDNINPEFSEEYIVDVPR
jgi:hypothetical protein